jgi:hypothetical protein
MSTPMTVEVPGSGRLTDEERQLLARVHTLVPLTADTPMFTILPAGALRIYLGNQLAAPDGQGGARLDSRTVGGYVARLVDAEELTTPAALIEAFHWDHPSIGLARNAGRVHLLEFPAGPVDRYTIPFGAPAHPDPSFGLPFDSAQVEQAADAMVAAAGAVGIDPASYTRVIDFWPYTGTGMTPNALNGLPVWLRRYDALSAGAMIFEYDTQGQKNPVARYRGRLQGWEDLR